MKLYCSIDGQERLVGEPKTPEELGEMMLTDSKTRFTVLKGKIKLDFTPGVVYADQGVNGMKYLLKD